MKKSTLFNGFLMTAGYHRSIALAMSIEVWRSFGDENFKCCSLPTSFSTAEPEDDYAFLLILFKFWNRK